MSEYMAPSTDFMDCLDILYETAKRCHCEEKDRLPYGLRFQRDPTPSGEPITTAAGRWIWTRSSAS